MSQSSVKATAAHRAHLAKLSRAFRQNLGLALTRRNLTLSEAGRRIGVTRQAVQNWSAGELPEWPNVAALSLALNIPLSELFDGVYDKRPADEVLAELVVERVVERLRFIPRLGDRIEG